MHMELEVLATFSLNYGIEFWVKNGNEKQMESCKRKFTESETQVLKVEEENQSLRGLQTESFGSKTDGIIIP